jgi:hypothetical protein
MAGLGVALLAEPLPPAPDALHREGGGVTVGVSTMFTWVVQPSSVTSLSPPVGPQSGYSGASTVERRLRALARPVVSWRFSVVLASAGDRPAASARRLGIDTRGRVELSHR